jgi:23S rRNA (guanosine2251-2'-O)-methyltransferase
VVIPKDRAVQVTGTVAKASAGAVEHCPVAQVVNLSRALEELKAAGVWIAAADPASTQPLWKARLDGPMAIVVGAEGAGVREGVFKHCDFRLQIPMIGRVGSLNASVSAAVLLYEVARQRAAFAAREAGGK